LKPGDPVKVDPVDGTLTDVWLLKQPGVQMRPFRGAKQINPVVGSVARGEVGLLIALIEVEREGRDGAVGGRSIEACVLFGTRFGWNDAQCFSSIE